MAIPGRVGYQCSNFYRHLIEKNIVQDPNYVLDEKGKAHFVFSNGIRRHHAKHTKRLGLSDSSGNWNETKKKTKPNRHQVWDLWIRIDPVAFCRFNFLFFSSSHLHLLFSYFLQRSNLILSSCTHTIISPPNHDHDEILLTLIFLNCSSLPSHPSTVFWVYLLVNDISQTIWFPSTFQTLPRTRNPPAAETAGILKGDPLRTLPCARAAAAAAEVPPAAKKAGKAAAKRAGRAAADTKLAGATGLTTTWTPAPNPTTTQTKTFGLLLL
jgi:hypothetical protein